MVSCSDPQTIIITIIFCHSIKAEISVSVFCMYSETAYIFAIPPVMKLAGAILFYSPLFQICISGVLITFSKISSNIYTEPQHLKCQM